MITENLFQKQQNVYIVKDLETLKKEMERELEEITSTKLEVDLDFFEDGYPDLCVFIHYGENNEEEVKSKIDDVLENPNEISLLANALLSKLLGKEVSYARMYFEENRPYIKVEVV